MSKVILVEFDPFTEAAFFALLISFFVSPFISLIISFRSHLVLGVWWSIGFLIFAVMTYGILTWGDTDWYSSIAIAAVVFVLVPNLLFAFLGRGLAMMTKREKG